MKENRAQFADKAGQRKMKAEQAEQEERARSREERFKNSKIKLLGPHLNQFQCQDDGVVWKVHPTSLSTPPCSPMAV